MANTKLIGAILGTFALGGMSIARAEDAPAGEKPAKAEKGKKKGKDAKGGEMGGKSCDGKK